MRAAFPILLISLAACVDPEPPAHQAPADLVACARVTAGEVRSIHGAVDRLNALPPSADAACFVASLPRPLSLVATVGITSAQPANGRTSPRVFVMLDGVVASVVPDGDGAPLVEFGQWVSAGRTLKAEVELPLTQPLTPDDPFTRVRYARGNPATSCALCHREEAPHPTLDGGFVSLAYQPQPRTFVTVDELRAVHEACVSEADPAPRCRLIHGLFDFGSVRQGAFPSETPLFAP